MDFVKNVILKKISRTAEALTNNGFKVYTVRSRDELISTVKSLIPSGAVCASGGSMTLEETGVTQILRSGEYNYIDRQDYERENMHECFCRQLLSDVYLMSSNAVTEKGELYNVDGNGNRVAALAYGPKSVIVIIGANKIVRDINEAVVRVKCTASPANTERLERKTYCNKTGMCVSMANDGADICDGCQSKDRICCQYLITGKCNPRDRIKVIISEENYGY